ncbi:YceI family protein [Draconibacterium sp. IB214405]|uniref:YceI family protein n=1 Tax=Draconibacterium sp. IB214405 TaxID=3097352 RepID=UPI002A0FF744|nr:YceI family protein [Draconibacterium sp. IB214405]MDX8341114.1 YceI family protein [Draconibacterium sp. IB214405]
MKKLTTLLVLAITITTAGFASSVDGDKATYSVDTKASKVYWTGKKVTGEHTGYLNLAGGEVFVEGNDVTGANLSLDLTSIEVTDLQGEWKDKLVGHLKSDDFFSVEKHPVGNFKITSVKNDKVTGDLTIKGITNEVSFPAEIKVDGKTLSASGTASIDRTKWDIKYNSGSFFSDLGDNMIKDEFEIKFELKATASEGVTSSK